MKIVVGVSGGVDSAVAALLLKKLGHHVAGAFMKNWDEVDEKGMCSAEKDRYDAQRICQHLQIPFVEVNFVKQYWIHVFSYLIKEYEDGNTPNPDVMCNRHIKFNSFIRYCGEVLGAHAVATGHYARTNINLLKNDNTNVPVRLLKAADEFKDQTFFLSQINQDALRKIIFPLGHLTKVEVKRIAESNGLFWVNNKKESTGICFIGKRKFNEFLANYINSKPGTFLDIESGKTLGKHEGIHSFTLGQSCRLSGFADKYFVVLKQKSDNALLVAPKTNHAALFTILIYTEGPHWIAGQPACERSILNCHFRFQHTKPLRKCKVYCSKNGLVIILDRPLKAITPGQFAVLYNKNECIGSARIVVPGPSLYVLKKTVAQDYEEYEHFHHRKNVL